MALFAFGCSVGEEVDPARDRDYFPLRVGVYQIYDVEEIQYISPGDYDTSRYELKTVVVDSFQNSGNGYTYVMHRMKRFDALEPWQMEGTWSLRVENNAAIVAEGNIAFVKLRFPFVGQSWDLNEFNNNTEDVVRMTDARRPVQVGSIFFPRSVTIEHENFVDDFVGNDVRREVYAKDVGLVRHEVETFSYCTNVACFGNQIIDNGVKLTQIIKSYGDE